MQSSGNRERFDIIELGINISGYFQRFFSLPEKHDLCYRKNIIERPKFVTLKALLSKPISKNIAIRIILIISKIRIRIRSPKDSRYL
jgi:hypothetical protein